MKIIDIYNKVAKGEEVPHFIIDEIEYYVGSDGYIKAIWGDEAEWTISDEWLNEEVQIIEEVEDKEYEDIEEIKGFTYNATFDERTEMLNQITNKINALIRNQKKILERLDKGE